MLAGPVRQPVIIVMLQQPENKPPYMALKQTGVGEEEGRRVEGRCEQRHAGDVDPLADVLWHFHSPGGLQSSSRAA